MRKKIKLRVNGVEEVHEVEVNATLLDFLRDTLDLTGAKEGCNEGECGACMVLLDGKAVNSCLVLAVEANGREVTTVEGLADGPRLHPVQRAFLARSAVQCGFCTPGMIITAVGMLNENPEPTEADVKHGLCGNLCRCGTYMGLRKAALQAAREMKGGKNG